MNLHLKSAKLIEAGHPQNGEKVDILITSGKISSIKKNIETPDGYEVYEHEDLHVSSGWFDSSVSFGEPGYEERETLNNGLRTAALSGFTAVAVNPETNPVTDHNAAVNFLKSHSGLHGVSLYPVGALTMKSEAIDLAELFDMKNAGAVAFGDYKVPVSNANLLKIALQYALGFDALVMSFPHDLSIAGKGVVNEDASSTRLGLKGIPALAEELRISRDLFILDYTGGKLHIPTITTARSVQLIRDAKKQGLNVSCSAAVHHLFHTDTKLEEFDTRYKVLPPLRNEDDRKALIEGVKDGTIDFITSDHRPIDIENKKVEFDHALYGTVGLESAFGALNTLLPAETCVAKLTAGRERFTGNSLSIQEGNEADLTLFETKSEYTFDKDHILSSSLNSAFLGESLKGRALGIIANQKFTAYDR
ncbi:dihydroorotase [Robertkochia aurantiaca]|uniref:dihydroorotase n=1 Tax=Robertkochia aurantiaca TaxID=2873700 RepID=UPI001CCC6318|nr:dihydroorotase [Robertkochia sp. 3YJGBD-33]